MTGFDIEANNIHDLRSGVRINGTGNTGSITGNTIENTKGAVLFQYTDGTGVTVSGNTQGQFGNEWGVVLNLNLNTPINSAAPHDRQAHILSLSQQNAGFTVLDRQYQLANRSSVFVDDNSTATAVDDFSYGNGLGNERQPLKTIQSGVYAVVAGGTVNVEAGTYTTNGQVEINKNLTITGDASARATITSGTDMTGGNAASAWILVDPNVTFNLSNVVIDGSGHAIYQALRNEGNATVDNVDFKNISGGAGSYVGEAIESFGGLIPVSSAGFDTNGSGGSAASLTVTNSTFENIGRIGILVKGDASTANITGITYTGKGAGDWLDYGVEFGAGGTGTVSDSTITGALGIATGADGSTSAGIQVTSYYGPGTQATIENNTITGNWAAVDVGYDSNDTSIVHASGNDFSGNTHGVELESALATADFSGNWWGSMDPSTIENSMTGASASSVDFSPFLMNGTDTDTGTAGFQGDFSNLAVTTLGGGGTGRIEEGVTDVTAGGTVNILAGNYTLSGQLDIAKSLTLDGAGVGVTNITSNSTGYGINVTADNVSLQSFTYHGPTYTGTDGKAATYGIKVTPADGSGPTGRLLTFDIENVTIDQGYRTGLDLNGVDGATIKNVSVSNIAHGDGIALTDSANVTITGSSTSNNLWGGLVLNQTNHHYDQQTANISVDASNSFNDAIPVFLQDESIGSADPSSVVGGSGLDFGGGISIAGFGYAVKNSSTANEANTYTWLQKTQQNAIDFATSLTGITGSSTVQDWTGTGTDQTFTVGTGTNSVAMSIAAANAAASNGATIDVLAGTYTLPSTLTIGKSLSLVGAGEGATTIDGSGMAFGNAMRVSADNVSLGGFTLETSVNGFNGISVLKSSGFDGNGFPLSGQGVKNFSIANVTINEHAAGFSGLTFTGVEGAAVNHVTVDNGGSGNAIQIADSANVMLTNNTTSNADFGFVIVQNGDATSERTTGVSADTSNSFVATLAPVSIIDVSTAGPGMGALDIEGFALAIGTPQHLELHNGLQGTIDRAAALDATNSFIEGWTGTGVDNNFTVGTGTGTLGTMSIAAANAAASDGAIINVLAGNYTLAGELDITKSLSLIGTGPATVITSNSTGYGINVTADDVSLKLFTFNAPTTHNGTTYGIKVTPDTNVASDRLLNFNIDGVTINGGWRTGLDLNGVLGATIQNVSVSNVQNGNGIALTDSANVTIVNDTTSNNAWGGLALYQTNTYYDQQLNNIVVSSLNNFGEANGVYEEDQSASLDMGSLTLAGYNAAAIDKSVSNDQYTFFQRNADAALAFATNGALNGGHLNAAHTYVEGWNGTALNNIFNVGPGLTIQAAENAAAAGGTINVSTGTYAEDVTVGTQLSFDLGDVGVNSFTLGSSAAGSSLNGNLTATSAIASSGTVNLNGKFTAASIAMSGAATLTGSSMLDTSAANGNIAIASVVAGGGHALALKTGTGTTSLGDVANAGSITALGAVTLTGTNYGAGAETLGATTLTGDTTFNTGDGNVVLASLIGGGHAATVVAGNTSLGNVANAGGVAVNGAATLTGSSYSGSSFAFGGPVALTNDTTLGATGAITLASLDGGGNDLAVTSGTASLGNVANAGALSVTGPATLTGTSYVAGSIGLGATTLTGNTTLDTSAANGAISVASVDGTTAGGQSLGINAGSGSVSLGNLGAATRMGAVSDASKTTLTGSTYNANSFLFGGDVTLTSANTTLNTTQSASAAGGITFQGDLFGTTDGGQSLTLTAGPGTGAASANGDILLQNAGTTAINLNNLTVSGDDFTALTVDLAGNYNSQLTGNQVFAADTLNVKGNANSTVGGDASGHIVAGGDVATAAGGDISGTISGQNVNLTGDDVNSVVTATNAANIKGNTVEGSYTANTVTLIASNNVDAAVDATDFTLAANHGSVDGNWVTINTDGSNVVSVNGQTTVGLANVNPNQLVVEGFVLPAGTRIGANGQLILPQGVLLGLLSPGGGKPKMILVHSVQQLGELLAGGYSVIVIDLSNRDSGKPIQLASN